MQDCTQIPKEIKLNDGEKIRLIDGQSHYWVTSHGRVFSGQRKGVRSTRELNPSPAKPLYKAVQIPLNGKRTPVYIHHIVAHAFIGPRPEGMYVAHEDGDCHNNTVENLRYVTPAENSADLVRHKLERAIEARQDIGGLAEPDRLEEFDSGGIRKLRGDEVCMGDSINGNLVIDLYDYPRRSWAPKCTRGAMVAVLSDGVAVVLFKDEYYHESKFRPYHGSDCGANGCDPHL
jgi:hypothetical protein